jgi:hypothetical protein
MNATAARLVGAWTALAASATLYAGGMDIHLNPANCVAHGVLIKAQPEENGTYKFHVTVTPKIGAFPLKEIHGQVLVQRGTNMIVRCDVANMQMPLVSSGRESAKDQTLEYWFEVAGDLLTDSIFTVTWIDPRMSSYTAWWVHLADFQQSKASARAGAANGSQPIRSETNSTSSTAGSRR